MGNEMKNVRLSGLILMIIIAFFLLVTSGCVPLFNATTMVIQDGEKSTLVISPSDIEDELEDPLYELNKYADYRIDIILLYLSNDGRWWPDYELRMKAGGDAHVDVSHLRPGRYYFNARVKGEKFKSIPLEEDKGLKLNCVIDSLSFEIF